MRHENAIALLSGVAEWLILRGEIPDDKDFP